MKIYVDEMPKSCNSCPFQDYETNTCCCEKSINCCWQNGRKAKNCPLQSIADHDKQVRKEVVEKIRKTLSRYIVSVDDDYHYYMQDAVEWQDVVGVLDQIERGITMANNRIFIRCKQCGECLFLGKHFNAEYYWENYSDKEVHLEDKLNDFFEKHCWCEEEYDKNNDFCKNVGTPVGKVTHWDTKFEIAYEIDSTPKCKNCHRCEEK